jgi:hypothetical protein
MRGIHPEAPDGFDEGQQCIRRARGGRDSQLFDRRGPPQLRTRGKRSAERFIGDGARRRTRYHRAITVIS